MATLSDVRQLPRRAEGEQQLFTPARGRGSCGAIGLRTLAEDSQASCSSAMLVVPALLLLLGPPHADTSSMDWGLQMDGDTRPDVDSSADYVMAEDEDEAAQLLLPEIYSLHITSHIQLRYAVTVVTSRIANPANFSQEMFFNVMLPETAFISEFTMELNGKIYKGYVEEKNEAKRKYHKAIRNQRTAAHITQSPRDSKRFTVSINLEPESKVNFTLKYEELLMRKKFGYVHTINIDPGQIVPDLYVVIEILESTSITYVKVPSLKVTNQIEDISFADSNDPLVRLDYPRDNSAVVHWFASPQEQKELREAGVKGQVVLTYDVERDAHEEQILVSDGYFVHFFAPNHMVPLRKHVIFLLDCSRSMFGLKMDQVKAAMRTILNDLNKGDFFSLVFFATKAKVWSPRDAAMPLQRPNNYYKGRRKLTADMVVPASSQLVSKAIDYLYVFDAHGSTNLNDALLKAFELARLGRRTWKKRDGFPWSPEPKEQAPPESMLVLLTDGLPTRGRTDANNIAKLVAHKLNRHLGAAVFALGFGNDVDMNFLKMLSLCNSGFARKIYEASDAALQLQDFYKQIASPLLANVTFHYLKDKVVPRSLTETHFPYLYHGSELVVAGRLRRQAAGQEGTEVGGKVTFRAADNFNEVRMSDTEAADMWHGFGPGIMERLWAYLTIRQLLDHSIKKKHAIDRNKKALRIALKYSFVTPVTSMVVTKPYEVVHVEPLPIHFQGASETASGWPLVAATDRQSLDYLEESGSLTSETDSLASCNQAKDEAHSLADLHWLHLVTDGIQVALPTGENSTVEFLELGSTEQDLPFQPCFTPENSPGHCRHLPHCVRRAIVRDLSHYLMHFCRIGSFAGVCCPDEEQDGF